MIKPIIHDPFFLAQKSEKATRADAQVITDLKDTLMANAQHCVGMAANMIGVLKNIIIVADGPRHLIMVNPTITEKTGKFETEEGCLSLALDTKISQSPIWMKTSKNNANASQAGQLR